MKRRPGQLVALPASSRQQIHLTALTAWNLPFPSPRTRSCCHLDSAHCDVKGYSPVFCLVIWQTEEIYQKGTEEKAPGFGGRATKDLYCRMFCSCLCCIFRHHLCVFEDVEEEMAGKCIHWWMSYSSCEGTIECSINMDSILCFALSCTLILGTTFTYLGRFQVLKLLTRNCQKMQLCVFELFHFHGQKTKVASLLQFQALLSRWEMAEKCIIWWLSHLIGKPKSKTAKHFKKINGKPPGTHETSAC